MRHLERETMLPNEITMQTNRGDRKVSVNALNPTGVPKGDGGRYAHVIEKTHHLDGSTVWDGHCRDTAKAHLTSWTFPKAVTEVARRTEEALSEGIPDQKRSMLRNQDDGMLDDLWVDEIALGEEIDNPFCRWSKNKRGEVRVAICLDGSSAWWLPPTTIEARMAVAAGIASALESLDYDVSVTVASLLCERPDRKPRRGSRHLAPRQHPNTIAHAMTMKGEDEPMVDSGFAHYGDTGFGRMIKCWTLESNAYVTTLSDREWRDLVDADFYIYVGTAFVGSKRNKRTKRLEKVYAITDEMFYEGSHGGMNMGGRPDPEHGGFKVGPVGDDSLRLLIDAHEHIDAAVARVENFFTESVS